jgi:uncharacterized spore protein YtfJ
MLAERERLEPMPWDFGIGSGEGTFSASGDGFGCGGGGGITGNGATSDPDVQHSVGRDDIEVHQVNRDDAG